MELLFENLQIYFLKRSTSNCHVKYDSVEKRWSYRLFNMAAYRFFLARSSWNCCIIFKTGYQVAKDGCILSKRKQKLIACITLTTCFQISSKTAIVCCPPDSSSSRTARQHTQRAVGQLSRFHHKGPVASKFAGSKPNGLSHVGCNVGLVGGLLQA